MRTLPVRFPTLNPEFIAVNVSRVRGPYAEPQVFPGFYRNRRLHPTLGNTATVSAINTRPVFWAMTNPFLCDCRGPNPNAIAART